MRRVYFQGVDLAMGRRPKTYTRKARPTVVQVEAEIAEHEAMIKALVVFLGICLAIVVLL
jgi:hypothetical protein